MCVDRGWCHHSLYLICFFNGEMLFRTDLTMTKKGMRHSLVGFFCLCVHSMVVVEGSEHQELVVGNPAHQE